MGTCRPDAPDGARPERLREADAPEVWPELEALVEENKRLRELVIQLSTLVVRKVVEGP